MSAHLERAELLLQQSRPVEAEREASFELAANPESAHAHTLLARSRLAQKRLPDALDSARQAVALAPETAYCHRVLGYVLLQSAREKEALAAADAALQLDPEEANTLVLRSSVHFQLRRWESALADAEAALALEPENVEALNLRSLALTQLGRRDEALQTGDLALHRSPENAMAHAAKGWTCLHQSDPVRAQEHFREALRLEPDLEYARHGMLEALKARNPIYRGVLAYFLWMGRQSTRFQWAFVLLTFFGVRAVAKAAQSSPGLGLLLWPVVGLCYAFIYLSWTAGPMFNLLLRFNRFGRLVLSREERRGSTFFGLSLLPVAAGGIWWASGGGEVAGLATIAAAMISVCVAAAVYREGRNRRILAIATGLLIALAVLGLVTLAVKDNFSLLTLFFLGFLGFQFLANALRR
ncbi:MAG: tetratricopeptide repeat protein [Opitutaceae bacterium]